MKATSTQQEILLMTGTSFSNRQSQEKSDSDKSGTFPKKKDWKKRAGMDCLKKCFRSI
jgi:hypothetical protein